LVTPAAKAGLGVSALAYLANTVLRVCDLEEVCCDDLVVRVLVHFEYDCEKTEQHQADNLIFELILYVLSKVSVRTIDSETYVLHI